MSEECMFAIELRTSLSKTLLFIALGALIFVASIGVEPKRKRDIMLVGVVIILLFISAMAGYYLQRSIITAMSKSLEECPLDTVKTKILICSFIQSGALFLTSGFLITILLDRSLSSPKS